MRSLLLRQCSAALSRTSKTSTRSATRSWLGLRTLHSYEEKYAEKLQDAARRQGTSVDALRSKLREEQLAQRRQAASAPPSTSSPSSQDPPTAADTRTSTSTGTSPARSDSSPVKPLASLLNLAKLLETPHTSAQIQALWTAYHASRSSGTGRGFLCAALPTSTYEKMVAVATKYPSFVLPLARPMDPPPPTEDGGETGAEAQGQQQAYEFYFMQWAFHGSPRTPTFESETALFPTTAPSDPASTQNANPPTATVLFTPLVEFKLRQTFATPHLVLTFYPDLARSHDLVLLRGEITPSAASSSTPPATGGEEAVRYMLSQNDAHLLAMTMQGFYLWDEGAQGEGKAPSREELLKAFHERPAEFTWEALLDKAHLAS